jgi:BirA family transcriptional regulator, biotin operon repressor / biotin---[acetyl-CoA-carboxylase] ligase
MPYVYTDSPDFARGLLNPAEDWTAVVPGNSDSSERLLARELFEAGTPVCSRITDHPFDASVFITEKTSKSQYDAIVDLLREGTSLPDGTVCFADHGSRFHGLRERPWSALPGNIHLVVQFAPNRKILNYGIGFTILAAVSVVQTIDTVVGLEGKAATKWVNDIVIGEAKVCGVLTYTQAEAETVTGAVIGIGLNVEATPDVEPTIFVPSAVSLRDLAGNGESAGQRGVLKSLLENLRRNYDLLVGGNYRTLLNFYRERSAIIGRRVEIHPDSPFDKPGEVVSGRVIGIGDNLELFLEDRTEPVTKGRLALKS